MIKVKLNKGNETFFHGRYLNLTAHLFLSNILKYFNDSNSELLSFMTRANPKNENETKPNIFQWDIFTSYNIYFFIKIY